MSRTNFNVRKKREDGDLAESSDKASQCLHMSPDGEHRCIFDAHHFATFHNTTIVSGMEWTRLKWDDYGWMRSSITGFSSGAYSTNVTRYFNPSDGYPTECLPTSEEQSRMGGPPTKTLCLRGHQRTPGVKCQGCRAYHNKIANAKRIEKRVTATEKRRRNEAAPYG